MDNRKIDLLANLRVAELKSLDPQLHKELVDFCSILDSNEFPEAVMITNSKHQTLSTFQNICEKLKRQKKVSSKKKLKEAERLILSMNAFAYSRVPVHRATSSERDKRRSFDVVGGKTGEAPLPIHLTAKAAMDELKKELVRDYVQRFGDPSYYVSQVLPKLLRKSKTVDELRAWDADFKGLVQEWPSKWGDPASYVYYGLLNLLVDLFDRVKTPEELSLWGGVLNKLVQDHASKWGDPSSYVHNALPKLLDKVKTLEELRAASVLVHGFSSVNLSHEVLAEAVPSALSLAPVSEEAARLLVDCLGSERLGMSVPRMNFYLLSLREKEAVVLSLPEQNKRQAVERVVEKARKEYEEGRKQLFSGVVDTKLITAFNSGYYDLELFFELADELGVKKGEPLGRMAALDAKVKTTYSPDIASVLTGFTFTAKEVELTLPDEIEQRVRKLVGNALETGSTHGAVVTRLKPLLEKTGLLRTDLEAARQQFSEVVPEALLVPERVENAIQFLSKREGNLSPEEAQVLLALGLRHSGKESLFQRYAEGSKLTQQERNLLYTALTELPGHLEDGLRDALPAEDWQTLLYLVKNSAGYKFLIQMKREIHEKNTVQEAKTYEVQLAFSGEKHLSHLTLGKAANGCFGDYLTILLPKDVVAVPILEDGEVNGALMFLTREIAGKKSLVLIGVDPSESRWAGLTEAKQLELVDKLMQTVIGYCRQNDYQLYATNQAGGLSNREGLEDHVLDNYFGSREVKITPITMHPEHKYEVTTARPLK